MKKWIDRRRDEAQPEVSQEAFSEAVDGAAREMVAGLGPQVLFDGPLLTEWFIRYQLEREIQRAARHGRALSVVVMTPVPTAATPLSPEAVAAAAAAAMDSARVTDLIGWLSGNRILLVLPETDRDGAASAAYRLTSEMSRQRSNQGVARWTVTAKADGHTYESVDDILEAVATEAVRTQEVDGWEAKRRQKGPDALSA